MRSVLFYICSIAVIGGNLFQMEQNNHFKPIELSLKYSFPSESDENNGIYLKSLNDIGRDENGNMFLVDWKLSIIYKYDKNGKYLGNIGKIGQGPGEILAPKKIGIDENGKIFIYEFGNGRIQIFDNTGKYENGFKTFGYIQGIRVIKNRIFVMKKPNEQLDNMIDVYDIKGNKIYEFGKEERLKVERYQDVCGGYLNVDKNGNILMGWEMFPWITIYDQEGNVLKRIELVNDYYKENEKRNMENANSNERPLYRKIINAMVVEGEYIYAISKWQIIVFNMSGKIEKIYNAIPTENKVLYSDLKISRNDGKEMFYLGSIYPEPRVFVFSN